MSIALKNRNKKGLTLVEVTVALAVFAILVAVASGIIVAAGHIFAKESSMTKAMETANGVSEVLNSRLSFAKKIDLTQTGFKDFGEYSECIKISKNGSGEKYVSINRLGKQSGGKLRFDEACDTGAFDVTVKYLGAKKSDSTKNGMTVIKFLIEIKSSDGETLCSQQACIDLLNDPPSEDITGEVNQSNETKDLYINYSLAE